MLEAGESVAAADYGCTHVLIAVDTASLLVSFFVSACACVAEQVVLVALPGTDLVAISREVAKQCDALPRNETARKALTHSFAIQVGCETAGGHVT
jgi:hypothetical protein